MTQCLLFCSLLRNYYSYHYYSRQRARLRRAITLTKGALRPDKELAYGGQNVRLSAEVITQTPGQRARLRRAKRSAVLKPACDGQ